MNVLLETNCPLLGEVRRGKVRDMFTLSQDYLFMVATDRISAYDVVMNDAIPGKGVALTKISNFWFNKLSHIIDNHIVSTDYDEFGIICPEHKKAFEAYRNQLEGRSVIVRKANPLKIEAIVRGYITGSGWKSYKKNGTICGIKLPERIIESQKIGTDDGRPLYTPSTKAEIGDHDENISYKKSIEIVGEEFARIAGEVSIKLLEEGMSLAEKVGIIIADTKFELGELNGKLVLIDEVLTPDSSRFWPANDYEPGRPQDSFDKQFLRDYLSGLDWNKKAPAPKLPQGIINRTAEKYQQALEIILSID